jgi:hypothetical protein
MGDSIANSQIWELLRAAGCLEEPVGAEGPTT